MAGEFESSPGPSDSFASSGVASPEWWGEVLATHGRWLKTVIYARVRDAEIVEEIMQEVAVKVLQRGDQLRDRSRVAPWLYRLGVTTALEYRRKLGRRRRLAERVARGSTGEAKSETSDPLDWLLAEELRSQVRDALGSLPSRDAELLLLKYVEGWSYREIAENLSLTVSHVESRLHRARRRLRARLSNRDEMGRGESR